MSHKYMCVCVCVCMLVAQSCPTLCNPTDCSPPGPFVHGTLQARTLEWLAISFSKRNCRKKESEVTWSCQTLCNPMDCSLPGSSIHGIFQARVLDWVAISFSTKPQGKPEYTGVGSLSLTPANLSDPGIEPRSPALQTDSLPTELSRKA